MPSISKRLFIILAVTTSLVWLVDARRGGTGA